MWNNQGYDGFGGYDQGGGYLNNAANFNSPQQGMSQSQKDDRRRAQYIIPCTTSQILRAEQVDDKFTVDGIHLAQVTVVGMIRSAKEMPTKIQYMVDDMTGPHLEVLHFIDNDENTPDIDRVTPLRENTYMRAIGHVRTFGGKLHVSAFRTFAVTDMNELTNHILETMYVHIYLTKKHTSDKDQRPLGAGMPMTVGGAQPMSAGGSFMADQSKFGWTPQRLQVLDVIRSCADEEGVHINVICSRLKSIPAKSVREVVEFLSSEGHIYSTIDDDHYKSTDSV